MSPRVGVLALQGDFAEHASRLRELGCEVRELRSAADLESPLDALVLPGGESTVQAALLREFAMLRPIQKMVEDGLPVLGTCAGLVLLAQEVEHANGSAADGTAAVDTAAEDAAADDTATAVRCGHGVRAMCDGQRAAYERRPEPGAIATLPVCIRRNAYGRQLASFHTAAPLEGTASSAEGARGDIETTIIPLTFIRAPQIVGVAEGVEVLVEVEGAPVAVRYGSQFGITFHPELDADNTLYRLFLESAVQA